LARFTNFRSFVRQVGKTYRAEETEVPAAAKTVAISLVPKEMKHCTTAEINCVPLDSMQAADRFFVRKTNTVGREETMASKASITVTIRETMGIIGALKAGGITLSVEILVMVKNVQRGALESRQPCAEPPSRIRDVFSFRVIFIRVEASRFSQD